MTLLDLLLLALGLGLGSGLFWLVDVFGLEFIAAAASDRGLQKEDAESVYDNCVSTLSRCFLGDWHNDNAATLLTRMGWFFEGRTVRAVLVVIGFLNTFRDVFIGRRQGGIHSCGVLIKSRVDPLADCSGGDTGFCFDYLTGGDAPVNSISHSLSIAATT